MCWLKIQLNVLMSAVQLICKGRKVNYFLRSLGHLRSLRFSTGGQFFALQGAFSNGLEIVLVVTMGWGSRVLLLSSG